MCFFNLFIRSIHPFIRLFTRLCTVLLQVQSFIFVFVNSCVCFEHVSHAFISDRFIRRLSGDPFVYSFMSSLFIHSVIHSICPREKSFLHQLMHLFVHIFGHFFFKSLIRSFDCCYVFKNSYIHYEFIPPFIHLSIDSSIPSFMNSLVCRLIHLCIGTFTRPFIHLYIVVLIDPYIVLFIISFIPSFIHSLIKSFIHQIIYSLFH